MLSESDRQHIREEEIFRNEVRDSLTPAPTNRKDRLAKAVWNFLNTSVGGWLLTSVLAGFIIWLATTIKEHHDAAQRQLATRDAVRREVDFRLAAAERLGDPQSARDILDDVYIEPEYKEWGFGAVLYKLGDVSSGAPDLIDEVMDFKTTNRAGDGFHKRLSDLRSTLVRSGLIKAKPPQASPSKDHQAVGR